jgi:transcriptional regulator with XRE-family HTH domain
MTIAELPWTLGDVLAKTREMAGISPSEMAEQLHVHRNTITNWEHGRNKPRHSDLVVWAQIVGQPVDLFEQSSGWITDLLDAA